MRFKNNLNTSSLNLKDVQADKSDEFLSKLMIYFLWLLFGFSSIYSLLHFFDVTIEFKNDFLRINSFVILIWTVVTFFSALISSYSQRYLQGFKFYSSFMKLCLGFTLSVMLLVASNSFFVLLFAWFSMGYLMSKLIGVDKTWGEAREASKFAQKMFLLGTVFLGIGLFTLGFYTNEFNLSGLYDLNNLPLIVAVFSGLCIVLAGMIQSAIFPFHKWLLSAMVAPTPASALMHAGFVNGSGILFALFASLIFDSYIMNILFIIGGFTAIIAQFTKLIQVNVKQRLACSTIAQMGFMIMQCGLGFFNAAVAHLILHGFYKAYLFLSSGEEIAQDNPREYFKIRIKPLQAIVVLLFGILGAFLFAFWTGKGMSMDSGIFLTLIVAITVGQVTYNIVKEKSLSVMQKIILPPLLFLTGIGVYALVYNGVTSLMGDLPMIDNPVPLSWVQVVFGLVFLTGFFIMKLGVYRKLPWLYVKLMDVSKPHRNTVLMYKSKLS